MNTTTRLRRISILGVLGAGIALAAGVTGAQTLKEISVEAGRATKVVGHTSSGIPIEEVSLTRHVYYGDLDLRTHSGAVELERRVHETAQAACKQLDELYPLTTSESPACAEQAAKGAMEQVHALIAAAEQGEE
ncbi:MAG: UrcA family protein [Gammaproteobacteria bacterium]|nr:UrcA family protein [Gammaproteobacteria bacterium]